MAETEAEQGDDVETCRIAMEAALEKGMGFCDTEEARVEVLSDVVGISPEFDAETALDEGPGAFDSSVQTRQWVVARADQMLTNGAEEQPLEAINSAWAEADEELVSPDGDDEEEAADEADEEPFEATDDGDADDE